MWIANARAITCACPSSAFFCPRRLAAASTPTPRTIRRPRTSRIWSESRRSVQSRAGRRRGRSARVVLVGGGLRRQPRRARNDRNSQGQARIPLSIADHDPGEKRQGCALSLGDLSRRDDSRAHQSCGIQPISPGEGKRSAARPHGDHQGPLRALVPRRSAHLSKAGAGRAGVPQHASGSARIASCRGVRESHPPQQAGARRAGSAEEGADLRR